MGSFGVSQAVTRREDQRLLTGNGRYTDDVQLADTAYAYVLRAPATAKAIRLNCTAARQLPGVLAIYTAAELAAEGVADIASLTTPTPKPGTEVYVRHQPILANAEACFVGEGLAFIVAESYALARDAAELIELDYQTTPAVVDAARAAEPGAVTVCNDCSDNISFEWQLGDDRATAAAFAAAERVIVLEETNNRVIVNALETRAAVGEYDPDNDKLTLYTGSQMPNGTHKQLQQVLGLKPEQVRVRVRDVGGGFGAKNSLFPEQVLVLLAARRLQRPVKWIAERSEGLLSDFAGRDNMTRGELAVDRHGQFLGLRVTTLANLGAYTASRGNISPLNVTVASNTYRIPAIEINVKGVFTHTVPTDVYRGAGRPEILYLVERLVDVAAAELGVDRIALRRRNFIPPDAFPYTTPTGLRYDDCRFEQLMDSALEQSDWHRFNTRRDLAVERGRRRGIGLACYVERCGGGDGLSEAATLRLERDGSLTLLIGSMSNGQGHETAYSQIVAEQLGLAPERISVVQGDTDLIQQGIGTGGSWSLSLGGSAVWQAADVLIERAQARAERRLEAAAADIEFDRTDPDGPLFRVAGTDRQLSLTELARDASSAGSPLTGEARFKPDNHTFPYGCHVCEVEIDPDTGGIEIISYIAVHDFGRALNPLLLAGQVHGGVVQGLGQAFLEHTVYSTDGQLLSGSLMDYALPRAADLPMLQFDHRDTPCPANPLGVKGCGEAGAAGAPPAFINAVVDALSSYRVRHIDMPATPQAVWWAIHASTYSQ